MIPELTIRYGHDLRPESAECSSCGKQMPQPPSELTDSSEIVLWFSGHFIEHRHESTPPRAIAQKILRESSPTPRA